MRSSFALHFSAMAWAQIGALDAAHFDSLQRTLEHFAARAASWLDSGAPPRIDECVPITAGHLIAECTFDDLRRSVTVHGFEAWTHSSAGR